MSFVVCIMIHLKRRLERNPSYRTEMQKTLSKQVKGSQCEVEGGSTCTLSAKELLCCHFHETQAVPGALWGGFRRYGLSWPPFSAPRTGEAEEPSHHCSRHPGNVECGRNNILQGFKVSTFFPLTFKPTLPVIVTVSKKKKKEKKDCLQREFIPTGRERNPNAPRIEARMTGKMSNKLAQTK